MGNNGLITTHWQDEQYPSQHCQLSTVNCQLSTVNCQLSTVNCQLSTSRPWIGLARPAGFRETLEVLEVGLLAIGPGLDLSFS